MGKQTKPDAILIFAGHDPSGGAGVIADVQTVTAGKFHPVVVTTAVTAQSLTRVNSVESIPVKLVLAQAHACLADWSIQAVKVGLVCSLDTLQAIADFIETHELKNVVVDPVRMASGGEILCAPDDEKRYRDIILGMHAVLTPNKRELLDLSPEANPQALAEAGARAILVTDGDGNGGDCEHKLYRPSEPMRVFRQTRLQGAYHGSGCTLSSAMAVTLARGHTVANATSIALAYTFNSLDRAAVREGTTVPNRQYRRHAFKSIRGLYVITPDADSMDDAFLDRTEQALKGGARIIQFRNKTLSDAAFVEAGLKLHALCRRYDAILIINDRTYLVEKIGADGVHLGAGDGDIAAARILLGPTAVIGASCYNSLENAIRAQDSGADYVTLGAVYPSQTKPTEQCVTLQVLRTAVDSLHIPVVAIGGINADNATPLVAMGVDALAVITAVFNSDDIKNSAQLLAHLYKP